LYGGTERNPEISRKDTQYPGQESNLDPFIYVAAVVTPQALSFIKCKSKATALISNADCSTVCDRIK
jgi:hypothetical protein